MASGKKKFRSMGKRGRSVDTFETGYVDGLTVIQDLSIATAATIEQLRKAFQVESSGDVLTVGKRKVD